MNFEIKIPKSFSSGISKSKFKIDKLSHKIENIKNDKNKIEKDLYDYEFEPSLDNNNLTNPKIKSKIEYENKFENNKYKDKNDDNLINKLIKLKKEKHIFKKDVKDSNDYNLSKGNQSDLNQLENNMLKNENELIEKYNNILCENKRIKKSMIIQQILVNEMKKDLENIKLEKSKFNEKESINEENDININNNYKNILQQKNNIINELQNENMKLLNENLLLKEKLNEGQSQNHIETKILDELIESIKQIANNLGTFKKMKKIGIDNDEHNFFKNIFEPINGKKENLSIEDKINAINKFNNFFKSEIKTLLNHSIKEKNNEKKIYEYSNIDIDKEFNGLFKSENKFKYNDKINKTTTALDNLKTEKINNKFNLSNFKFNDRLEKSLLTKYNNNRYIVSNTDLELRENSNNKMRLLFYKNKTNLKKKLLEKEGVVFRNSYISNNKNILNDSKENIDNKIKEVNELITNKNILTKDSINFKNQKKIKIPVPKLQINKTNSYISSAKLNEKSFNYFDNIPLKVKLNLNKTNKTKKQKKINYSNYDTSSNEDNDRNKKSQLEHIKTDINLNAHNEHKLDFEYIKLNLIFKKMNHSNILTAEIKNTENSSKKYLDKKKNNNIFNKYMNSAPKFLKIKDIKKANGLADEVMKPSFLKTNISLTLNNDEKDKDKYIFKDIKRYEIIKKTKD